jgi:hypothetical protein
MDEMSTQSSPEQRKQPLVAIQFGQYHLSSMTDEESREMAELSSSGTSVPQMKLLGQGNPGYNIDGEVQNTPRVVILGFKNSNVMFKFEADSDRPDGNTSKNLPVCFSWDGVTSESGCSARQNKTCYQCKNNQFGSSLHGKGKRCKNTIRVFVLPEGSMIPVMWSIPPSGIKPFKKFTATLMRRGIRYTRTIIELSSHPEKAENGQSISVPDFKVLGIVKSDQNTETFLNLMRSQVIPAFMAASEGRVLVSEELAREPMPESIADSGGSNEDLLPD